MKRVILVPGIGLIAAAAAAVLVSTPRVALAGQRRSVRPAPGVHAQATRPPRRHCVRLGWKAPYWYAGA